MGKYNITDETLMRYHAGLCSEAESAAVEAWLEDAEEEINSSHNQLEEEEISAALWASIKQSTILKERKSRQLKIWYHRITIAASLLIASSAVFMLYSGKLKNFAPKVVQIDNFNGETAKAANIHGLVFTALPKGSIRGEIGHASGNITFCDVMLIQNKSVEDISLDFASNCSGISTGTKKFICKKGNTYVALRLSRVSPEVIVVDQRYMEDLLPLNVAMRINKDLQAI